MSPGNHDKKPRKGRITPYIFAIILLAAILLPMGLAWLLNNTSLFSWVPFTAEDWFAFWPGYFSLIASVLLDVFAILFSFYMFTDEKVRDKLGTIAVDYIHVLNPKHDGKTHHFTLKLIDNNPMLSYNHQIEIRQMNVYFCIAEKPFNDEDIFEKEFQVKSDCQDDMLPIVIHKSSGSDNNNDDTMVLTPMFCKNTMEFKVTASLKDIKPFDNYSVDFGKRNDAAQNIWLAGNTDTIDTQMLVVEYSYRIHNVNKYFNFKLLNKLYKNFEDKHATIQYNRIYLKLDNSDNQISKKDKVFKYEAVSTYRKIFSNK